MKRVLNKLIVYAIVFTFAVGCILPTVLAAPVTKVTPVNRVKRIIHVTSVSLNKYNISLEKGKKFKLTAHIRPDNATNKSVVWKTSNAKTAVVDGSGTVKAVSAGRAVITVKSADGGKTMVHG
jgi:uncharacterized protein YjdB